MLEYIFIAFVIIFCIQSIYYLLFFGKFAFSKVFSLKNKESTPISIIICAKNEEENLQKKLPLFALQKYSEFELVLINDASTDTTLEVMEEFKKTSKIPVKIVNIIPNEQFWGSKKYALTLGIKAASYKHLLFTDADCKPISNNWIHKMAQHFSSEKELILGYGKYKNIKNSLVNKLIRFETLFTAIQYFGYAKLGFPYMGVGRNIAYTKSLFFNNNGFVNHMKIKSGDDDLFVNEVATVKNTTICFSKDSFTISEPKKTFKQWIQQKRRHISTANYYKKSHKYLLGLFYLSQILFYILATLLLLFLFNWKIVLLLILIRFSFQYIIIGLSSKKLDEKGLTIFAPFYEILLILIQLFIFIKNLTEKPTHW